MSTSTGYSCKCKSSCSTKRKENSRRGCPCKGKNMECSAKCQCGTRAKPFQNKGTAANSERERDGRGRTLQTSQGFRLSHQLNVSEDMLREKENKDVKDFVDTLDANMVRKLAIRSLRRGIGGMDYIETLLIKEDDPNDVNEGESMGEFSLNTDQEPGMEPSQQPSWPRSPDPAQNHPSEPVPEWCKCGKCRPMAQEVENKCCKQKKCITVGSRFLKICLDPDVLELCIRNTSDIRNDREDNSTRAFRKAAYRQFILACHGYLGKGNRRVCPSCVVLKIREQYPSITGVYMGYREH